MFLVGMVAFSACNRLVETNHGTSLPTDVSPELSAIDSLMWQRPDSALSCLLPYFDTCCRDGVHTVSTTHDCHYANLLLAELLYKNDNPQLNRAELLQAVDYYDSLCCRDAARHVSTDPILMFLDARAHYINGVGYYERDSVVEACQEYLKALEVMEERFEEKEMVGEKAQFMALTYTRLTKNFSDLYLHEQAIYFGKKARKYYNKYEAQVWHLAWLFDEIGSNYNVTNNLDSAMAYFNKGIEMLPDSNNLAYRDLRVHIVFLSYVINKNRDAVLNQLRNLLTKSDSEKEYLSRCLTLGEVYFHEQQYDSAYLYLTKVYYSSKSVNAKKQAAEWLVDICKTQDKEDETVMYTDFLVPFATQDENKSFVKSQLAELYNGYKQYELVHQHRQIIKKQTRWGIALTSGLLVVILALFVLYRKYKKKKQNLEIQIKEEKYAHRIRQKALSGRLKRSNATIKEYGNKISPSIPQQNSIAEKFEDEPICQYILSLCNATQNPIKSTVPVSAYTSIALNDAQKAKLKNAAIMHFGPLFEILKIQHPQLKEKDFQYFYLCLLGLDNVQISVLLQNSLSTTWERENRLKKILGSEDRVAITLHGYMETS